MNGGPIPVGGFADPFPQSLSLLGRPVGSGIVFTETAAYHRPGAVAELDGPINLRAQLAGGAAGPVTTALALTPSTTVPGTATLALVRGGLAVAGGVMARRRRTRR